MRASLKIENRMSMAELVAELSHDLETKVGSILINPGTGSVIAEGFNGFVRGAPDTSLPRTRPNKYPFMIHSEENIISHCARIGIPMDGCVLICTHSPCAHCARRLYQAGITTVIFKTQYRDFDQLTAMPDINTSIAAHPDCPNLTILTLQRVT